MRNRNRLFHDFWSILASILEPKIDKKRQKNDVEIGVEFGDEQKVTFDGKSHFCGLGWRQGRWSPGGEFGDSGEDSIGKFRHAETPEGAADLMG